MFRGQFSGSDIRLESDVMPKQIWRQPQSTSLQSEPYLRWSFRLHVYNQEDVILTFHTPIADINDLLASIKPAKRKRVIPWGIWSASSSCITDRPTGVWAAHGPHHFFYSPSASTIRLTDFSPGAALGRNASATQMVSLPAIQNGIRLPRPAANRQKWSHNSPSMGGGGQVGPRLGPRSYSSAKNANMEPIISLQEILSGSFRTVFPTYVVEPSLELPDLPPCDEITMECDSENILICRVSLLLVLDFPSL